MKTAIFAPVVSITATARGRWFWAAWWTQPPRRIPFRKPDASNGGATTEAAALEEAQHAAGTTLTVIDPRWARGWNHVIRGRAPFSERDARAFDGVPDAPRTTIEPPESIWTTLGLAPNATLAEIKRAFKSRALATHPDQGGDADEFRAVRAAYDKAIARRSRAAKRPRVR